jgi:hypothetical protein
MNTDFAIRSRNVVEALACRAEALAQEDVKRLTNKTGRWHNDLYNIICEDPCKSVAKILLISDGKFATDALGPD